MVSTARQQHAQFQAYLMRAKDEVSKNLQSKIFPSTEFDDYVFFGVLGQGSYGQVLAARKREDEKLFAVKIIKKKSLVKQERLRHLMSEIRILNSINFEFLISLECYFTNKCSVFIVLPIISGGRFFSALRKVKKFEEHVARFFAGQVVLAIEYLHFMGIIYRDLKPENLLLDVQGYLKIVDYGFSKHIGNNYSYSFCGTAEYLAPEILLSKGHSFSPDWWTLGILLYEMCEGSPPFTSKNELKLYELILAGSISWPEHFSTNLRSIIQGLLQVDKSKRLGCMKARVQDIKFHDWFSPLDWNALWSKKISPPITFGKRTDIKETKAVKLMPTLQNCTDVIPSEIIGNIDFAI